MSKQIFYGILICIAVLSHSCKDKEEIKDIPEQKVIDSTFKIIQIETDFGNMHIWLYDSTKLHKANFLKLTEEGFYTGTEFHRLVYNFVIQGGDPNSKDGDRSNDGTGGPGYTIPAEIDSTKYKHEYGTVASARTGDVVNPLRASSGSQFYIDVNPLGSKSLDGQYTIFGKVIAGMNTAMTIVGQGKNGNGLPNNRIPMTVTVLNKTDAELLSEFGFARPLDR